MNNFFRAEVEFRVDNNLHKFEIMHNLPDVTGISFTDALNSWLARTDTFTDQSFVDYVRSKNTGFLVFTEKEFEIENNTTTN